MAIAISLLIVVVGCFVEPAGWLSGWYKKIANDGEQQAAIGRLGG
jgi:hypothetical protein